MHDMNIPLIVSSIMFQIDNKMVNNWFNLMSI